MLLKPAQRDNRLYHLIYLYFLQAISQISYLYQLCEVLFYLLLECENRILQVIQVVEILGINADNL